MPGGDRTGPEGRGPVTGRGLGYCTGYNNPGFTKGVPRGGRGYGRGWGRGFGRGFGRGRGFYHRDYYQEPYYEPAPIQRAPYQQPTRDEEKAYLEDMIKNLEQEIKSMKDRLQELSKEKKSSE
jgi:hypothetical protein